MLLKSWLKFYSIYFGTVSKILQLSGYYSMVK